MKRQLTVIFFSILLISTTACNHEILPEITDESKGRILFAGDLAETPTAIPDINNETQEEITKELLIRTERISGETVAKEQSSSEEKGEVIKEQEVPNPVGDIDINTDAILGRYTTSFATSSTARKNNIKNGAMKINGTTLLPGETFSCYDALAPFTRENGYEVAGAYQNGKIINSVGGGVCQISSTLYNAVLGAELEIVERHAHSMTVSYVDLARDAAIAGTYKDFCFTNDSKHPIAIKAIVYGDSLCFQILGIETRDKEVRTIKFETVIVSTTPPGQEVITYDQSKPRSFIRVTQRAHTGYEAVLYKVIYKNGEEVDRIKINSSVYTPTPAFITVGTGG